MIKYNTPQELFTAICDKIRDRIGSSELINHQDIPSKIDSLVDDNTREEYNSIIRLISNNNSIPNIFIDDTIQNLQLSFYNNYNLNEISLPECTSISGRSFGMCKNLTIIDLPKCTSIGEDAFIGCTSLTTVNLPECTSIGGGAFIYCSNLTTVNLPKCTSIGNGAFNGCNLTTLILNSNQVVVLNDIYTITFISNGTGYIYVPDNLVDSYKTATIWSTYANQIKPISELPSNLKEEYGYE